MDPNIRNFKDFLQLYNKLTELCFSHCVDNFFNRNIASDEAICVDRCVQKFTKVNQRIMGVYVEVQTAINARRVAELEEAAQQQQAQQEATAVANQQSQNQIQSSPSQELISTTTNKIENPKNSSSLQEKINLGLDQISSIKIENTN